MSIFQVCLARSRCKYWILLHSKSGSLTSLNWNVSAQMLKEGVKQSELKSEMLQNEYSGCGTKIDSIFDSWTIGTCQNSCSPEMWAKITRDHHIFSKALYTAFKMLKTQSYSYFGSVQIWGTQSSPLYRSKFEKSVDVRSTKWI